MSVKKHTLRVINPSVHRRKLEYTRKNLLRLININFSLLLHYSIKHKERKNIQNDQQVKKGLDC